MSDKEEGSESGGSNKIIMIVAGVVLFILIAIGGIIALLLSGDDPQSADAQAPTSASGNQQGNANSKSSQLDVKIDQTYLKIGTLYELDLFLVNLISRKGKRYLRTKISLEIDNDSLMAELDTKKPVLKDIILSILTSKTVEDLSTIKGKSRGKREIIATINKSLLDGKITNLFFTEFVIQ